MLVSHPTPMWFLIVVVLPLLLLFLLLVVLLIRGLFGRSKVETRRSPTMERAPSISQRREGLERSRSIYSEEQSRILGMLEKGTLTPEEAERLFATLDRKTSTMACPYCSGDVRIEAIRCKHCHRDLVAEMGKPRRLCKSRDRILSGVCGGLADYSGLDASMLRLLVVVATLFSGIFVGLIVYIIAAMVLPDPQ